MFYSRSFIVSGLKFVFNPCRVHFWEWCKIEVQLPSSAYGYPVFPTSFIEETVLFPLRRVDIVRMSISPKAIH